MFVLDVWRMGIMKFNIKVKFNGLYNYSESERVIEESDFNNNIRVLNAMLESGEIQKYTVRIERAVPSMGDHLRNALERSASCIN